MQKQFIYQREEKEYIVNVTYKSGMRYIRYSFRDGQFVVSCPHFTSTRSIIRGLEKHFKSLIDKNVSSKAEGENFIYIFGYRYEINGSGSIPLSNGEKLEYKDMDDLKKKITKWFKGYLEYRTYYYEQLMKTDHYKVHLKKMSSRYGSNSLKTHSISYSTLLIHYSKEIIDAIIVHELAHHFQRNHSSNFYKIIYQYCPDYKTLHNKLRKGEFR